MATTNGAAANGADVNGGAHTYDIIFAGGGTAACVIASRLAVADPTLKILIVEAGQDVQNDPLIVQPGRYFNNFITAKPTFYQHVGQKSEALGGRAPVVQAGKALGGSSAINFMMYTRAVKSDYDDWEAFGNPGWGSKDLIPLARKLETYNPPAADSTSVKTHGKSGPIKVSPGNFKTSVGTDFLDTASKYDPKRKQAIDGNDFADCNKYSPWYMYMDQETGTRSDTAHAYLYPLLATNQNLKVLTKHRVVRVLFDGTKATGIEYVDDTNRDVTIQATASKLVVVSGGTFGSPVILERSGIGSQAVLSKYGIQQVAEVPGVGENYHDHNLCLPIYKADSEATCFDPLYFGFPGAIEDAESVWNETSGGMMAHNAIDAGIKYRPDSVSEVESIGSDFSERWQDKFAHKEDKPIVWMGVGAYAMGPRPAEPLDAKYYSLGYFTTYPHSTGKVHIASSTNPYEPFFFEPGFLNEQSDVALLRWSYKRSREFSRRMKSYRGCNPLVHPPFPEHSQAALSKEDMPVDVDAPNLVYSAEDDAIIDAFHRAAIATTWHSLGTCAMKPLSDGGVVDNKLNVYGTQSLKVADMSIAPDNVGSNTYNTALIIGEKAALIIAEELGIAGV